MQASPTQQPSAGNSPFQLGGSPLFKTAGQEPITAPPINSPQGMSPFSVAGATPTNAPLTVGDVINQMPHEVVRAGALPPEQPLSLPPVLLENALRSGEAALPLFELYRVCPALFQVPISPQDPRFVPLPAAKLPGLIAQARGGQGAGASSAPPASASAPSPFSLAAAPAPAPTPSPSPFQLAPQPGEAGASTAQAFPMSPFAAVSPGFASAADVTPPASPFAAKPATAAAPPSPFSMMSAAAPQPQQPAAAASPFSLGGGAPFSMPQEPAESPFTPATPGGAAQASPFATAAGASPAPAVSQRSISSLFTPKPQAGADMVPMPAADASLPAVTMPEAVPPAAPAPMTAFSPPQQPMAPIPAAAPSAGGAPAASGVAKLGFAAVLSGFSAEELGFNPAMVPAWLTTSVPVSSLNEQIASGSVTMELGALIDGVSDLGFRNTLTAAKRGFQVRLPQNEVFHALTSAAAPAPAATPFGGSNQTEAAPRPATPAPNPFVIQPGAGPAGQIGAAPAFAAPETQPPPAPPPVAQNPLSVFASPAASAGTASTPIANTGAGMNLFAQKQEPEASATPPGSPSPFGFKPPVADNPASVAQFQPPPAAPAPSAPMQPLAGAFQPFGSPPASFGNPPAPQPSSPLAQATKPFDPFATASAPSGTLAAKAPEESGFSSAQLLGQAQPAAPAPFAFAPAPEAKAAANPFAAPAQDSFKSSPAFAPALDEIPAATAQEVPPQPASRGLFSTQPASVPLFAESAAQPKPAAEFKPAPAPAPAAAETPAKMAAVKHSFLGLSPVDTQTDQLLLRALLGTEEKLAAPRVVELLAAQHGLSACVCLHGSHVLSHADKAKPDAADFQRQAPDIARQLRGLAPLIGIDGAETFTLNAGGRLLTFCFPGDTIIGVLHDVEPSNGLRDKITLIARELARMLG